MTAGTVATRPTVRDTDGVRDGRLNQESESLVDAGKVRALRGAAGNPPRARHASFHGGPSRLTQTGVGGPTSRLQRGGRCSNRLRFMLRVLPHGQEIVGEDPYMIGSRLLFSGYGDGRSRRSMRAGSLGHNAVVVVDEVHLSPSIVELLCAGSRLQDRPEFRTMRLSAASVATEPAVRRRLFARKTARFEPVARGRDLVAAMCKAAAAHRTGAVAVFVRRTHTQDGRDRHFPASPV